MVDGKFRRSLWQRDGRGLITAGLPPFNQKTFQRDMMASVHAKATVPWNRSS